MEATPGHQAGMAAAVMTAGLDLGKMLGPLIGGLVAGAIGLEAMFRLVPFGFLLVYLVLALPGARRDRADRSPPVAHPSPAEEA
jgi:predicted MFS family arabinose efflux permease